MSNLDTMTVEELDRLIRLQRSDAYRTGRDDALALVEDLLLARGQTDALRLVRSLTTRTPDGKVPHEPPTAQLTAVPAPRADEQPLTRRAALRVIRPATHQEPR